MLMYEWTCLRTLPQSFPIVLPRPPEKKSCMKLNPVTRFLRTRVRRRLSKPNPRRAAVVAKCPTLDARSSHIRRLVFSVFARSPYVNTGTRRMRNLFIPHVRRNAPYKALSSKFRSSSSSANVEHKALSSKMKLFGATISSRKASAGSVFQITHI